jgi:dihydrodipicolinate synthase/N-acetylneuraminate lyase
MKGQLTAAGFAGILALPPTPLREDVPLFGAASTVDLDEAARAVDQLVFDGVGSIGLCGTTGECAALTWSERRELYATVVEAVAGRVPVLAGATALGTREVIHQLRELVDLGVDAGFVGLPMWQTPTVTGAVRFYADLAQACPQLPLMIYGNRHFFKFSFAPEFWAGVAADAPTVVACKVGFPCTAETYEAAGARVCFLHGESMLLDAWRSAPEIRCGWATSAAMGPHPWVAFFRAVAARDAQSASEIADDISEIARYVPDMAHFASYNTQLEKTRVEAAGYMRCGPPRPPYYDLPDDWRQAAVENGQAWSRLREQYTTNAATT